MNTAIATTTVEKDGEIVGHIEVGDGTGSGAFVAVSHTVTPQDTPEGFDPILRRHTFGYYERGTSFSAAEAWVRRQAR